MRLQRIVLITSVSALAACGDGTGPAWTPKLEISVITSGLDPDSDGYFITIDGTPYAPLPLGETLVATSLSVGNHLVELGGMAANCGTSEAALTVSLEPRSTSFAVFQVTCTATTGIADLVTSTDGLDPDTDGYLISIDGQPPLRIASSGHDRIEGLSGGPHTATLSDLAANCSVAAGTDSTTFDISVGGLTRSEAPVAFHVTCTATTAVVAVATSTTGPDPDADGYEVAVDGSVMRTVPANSTVYIERVGPGTHLLKLQGFALNCVPVGDPAATVTLSTGGLVRDTARVSFSVQCTRPITRITVQTTGTDIDPDGYVLFVDCPVGGGYCLEWDVLANDLILTNSVRAGQHSIGLRGVASNCAVSGDNPSSVSFAGDTVDVAFAVECYSEGRLRVTTHVTGTDIDGDGFSAVVSGSAGTSGFAVPVNGQATSGALAAGPGSVTLLGVSINCTVSSLGSVPVTIANDAIVDVSFDVSCVPAAELAVSMTANGNKEIYRLKVNDTAPQRLTFSGESETNPAWSPDGALIAFTSDRNGKNEIYTMDADGSGQRKVTNLPGDETADDAAWSPDGTRIAFTMRGGGLTRVYVVNADGSGLQWTGLDGRSPSWSPDGQRIVFWKLGTSSWDELVVAAVDGTSAATIAYGAAPAWSPDGTRIAYLSDDYYSNYEEGARLRLVNVDGTGDTDLHWDVSLESPTWSPDGDWIAADRGADLLIISPAGLNPRTIPGSFGRPSWRP